MPPADCAAPVAPDGDSAHAETVLPLAQAEVEHFVRDPERLWRLNPHIHIESWQALPDGFRCHLRNELNGFEGELAVRVDEVVSGAERQLRYDYARGLRLCTEITVATDGDGSRLTLVDRYPRVEDPEDPRLVEVDRSLVPWLAAIRRHLLARQRWGWLPGWRWWNEHLLAGMPPRSRRIVRLIVWISAIEFVLFAAVVVVWRLMD
ncbi:MAG TPA: hypothetical protein VIS73_09755 [Rhodocyclaceae bacterium]